MIMDIAFAALGRAADSQGRLQNQQSVMLCLYAVPAAVWACAIIDCRFMRSSGATSLQNTTFLTVLHHHVAHRSLKPSQSIEQVVSNNVCCHCRNEFWEKALPHEMPHLSGIKVSSSPLFFPLFPPPFCCSFAPPPPFSLLLALTFPLSFMHQ